jgi:glycosyltransferase involved in cell wall biosynthesis
MLSPAVPELVSIVTPFHDDLRFFGDTAASVFGQTYPEWEWLLVDDGSTSDCAERARRFAASHPERVRYLRQPDGTRHGEAAARNIGIAESRGEYLALLDVDDVWFPGKLSVQTEILNRHPELAMVYNPLYFWYSWPGNDGPYHRDFVCPMGEEHDTVVEPPAAVLRQIRIADGLPGTCSALLRADAVRAVGGFEETFDGMYADEVFFSKICLRYRTYLMRQHFDLYRQHESSSSGIAARKGEYVPGPAIPSPARQRFLEWLLRIAAEAGQDDVAGLVRNELETNYASLAGAAPLTADTDDGKPSVAPRRGRVRNRPVVRRSNRSD